MIEQPIIGSHHQGHHYMLGVNSLRRYVVFFVK